MTGDVELDAFIREWNSGPRDRITAKAIARAYVEKYRANLAPVLEQYSREDLVGLVTEYRASGRESDRVIADMWLLTQYEPQDIRSVFNLGGSADPRLIDGLKETRNGS